jgi:hypothetical protein
MEPAVEIYGNLQAILPVCGQARLIATLLVASAAGLVFCWLARGSSPPNR